MTNVSTCTHTHTHTHTCTRALDFLFHLRWLCIKPLPYRSWVSYFVHKYCMTSKPFHFISICNAAFFVVISYVDTSTLYCRHQSLQKSLDETTAFCIIAGTCSYAKILPHFSTCTDTTLIINFCRNSILLQLTSASCVLALSRGSTLLESGISISCESLSDGTPCQIRPHCVCCDLSYLPKYCCDTHYG